MQRFLHDEQLNIVTEAARAIHDLPLDASYPSLAALAPTLLGTSASTVPEALARRVINANFRLGNVEHVQHVLGMITEPAFSVPLCQEAIGALIDWEQPSPRDRVTGFWRPIAARDPAEMVRVRSCLADNVAMLLSQAGSDLQPDVVKLVTRYQLPTDEAIFAGWVSDTSRKVASQTAALRLLATRKSPLADATIEVAIRSDRPELRAEARDMLALLKPADSVGLLESTLNNEAASLLERQRAVAALSLIRLDAADRILKAWMDRLTAGSVPDSLQLDVLDAATTRDLPELKQAADQFRMKLASADLMTRHRISLHGGDAERGREIFVGHRVGQCVRCHKAGSVLATGGTAGPDLHQVATRHDRASLLQSLVDPNAKIAKGFETVTLVMQSGQVFGGLIRKEDEREIVLEQSDGRQISLKASDVEERSAPKSAMPEMNRALSPRELRDVVEFLSQLR
jgi:quinoprotein glucose dehydrogenase